MFATAQKANAKPSNSSLFQRDKGSDAFIQPKLNIGKPGDAYEVEADRVADTVVARGNEQPSSFFSPSPSIQTQPQQEAIQEKSLSEDITPLGQNNFSGGVQEKCAECQEEENVQTQQIQRKGSGGVELPPVPEAATKEKELEENVSIEEQKSVEAGEKTVPAAEGLIQLPSPTKDDKKEEESPIQTKVNTIQRKNSIESSSFQSIESSLASSKGNGTAMPSATQREMSSGFGTDFSNVNIHTDSSAVHMNKALGAHAFTHGSDIYFNEGKYNPESESGKHLLAHELTHTVQQGAAGEAVQRFVPTEKVAAPEGNPERPNDGAEVEGKSNSKINNDENVQDQDDLSDEEKREKQDPPRGEVRQERSEVQSEGVSTPPVDRGAEALDTISAQREQMNEQLSEEGEGEAEGETTEVPTAVSNMGQADAAAQQSLQAEQMAMSVEIPEEPQPFRHPNVIAPVDSAGEAIPRQSSIDTQVRGLGYIGEMLRGEGYEMIRHAAEKEIHAYGLDAVLGKQREDLALAKEGTQKIENQNAERKEISEKSKLALDESIERQQFVAAEAPGLAQEADGGKSDSSALASDASSKSAQSQSEIPDDPDARADAEQQSGEMEQTAQGAQSMDDAITQTGERARQYGQDAEVASQDNEQSQASIQETDATIALIDGRSAEMTAQNEASNASIENAGPGPALIRQHAQQTAASGEELISASIVMELELIALQDEYLNSVAALESKEAAEQRIQEEQEQGQDQPDVSPEEQQLYELGAMSDEEQEQSISQMTEEEKTGLMAALDSMIASAPDNGTDATEGARTRVDLSGVNNAISSAQSTLVRAGIEGVAGPVGTAAADALGVGEQPPPDPRAPEIQEIDNQRTQRVGGVLDIADQNMNFLTQQQQQQLAERLVGESITDDIKNINILQMGRDMLLGMVNPAMALQGVVGGFEKTFTGVANIFNAEAWAADPLGNLLQVAADISTGLAMIFSSILGIAGMITALMIALTIISWGTLSPITAPVIGWMGTVMTYAGWGAIVSGLLSVYFNSLAYIKNLHDAGTAETARELFGNTEQMKQNTTDGFQGAMAVVEGIGAVKMGPSMSNGDFMANVPRSPGAFARQTIDGAREGLSSVASLPGRAVRGARRLLGSGRQGLITFKNKITGFFRRSGRLDADVPNTRRNQGILDDNRTRNLDDMTPEQRRVDLQETANHPPRAIDPDSPHYRTHDVEIESNGHTYRRRRDGNGWCRFSAQECGIREGELPDDVRAWLDDNDQMLREHGALDDSPEAQAAARRDAERDMDSDARQRTTEDMPERTGDNVEDLPEAAPASGAPGSPEHKAQRWQDYQDRGGEWTYERWSKQYEVNMRQAPRANAAMGAYHERIGWGEREVTLDADGQARRLDIADISTQRGIEHKTGYQTANQHNLSELARDRILMDNGWQIEWVFEGTASQPLQEALTNAGIPFKFV